MALGNVRMDDVRIVFRNFAGKEDKYNKEGQRSFVVALADDVAAAMQEDGWNVKWLEPREEVEGDTPQAILHVALRYDVFPPRVVLVTARKRRVLEESELEILDQADILNADLIVRPRPYDVNGKTGIKAYAKTLYVVIEEDELDAKWDQEFEERKRREQP